MKKNITKFLNLSAGAAIILCAGMYYAEDSAKNTYANQSDVTVVEQNTSFIKNKILNNRYNAQIDNLKIIVKDAHKTDNIALFFASISVEAISKLIEVSKGADSAKSFSYDMNSGFISNIKGQNNYYQAEVRHSNPNIVVSLNSYAQSEINSMVFQNKKLTQDFVFFHEFSHYLTDLAGSKNEKYSNDTIFSEIEPFNKEKGLRLYHIYSESVADIMAINLLQRKYENLDIKEVIYNLAKYRDSSANRGDKRHNSTLALLNTI